MVPDISKGEIMSRFYFEDKRMKRGWSGTFKSFGIRFSFCCCKMLQGIFDFQCMMDGADVRYWKALLAPMLPLIFLILCGFFELVKRGSGCLIAEFLEKNQKTGFITSCLQLTLPN